jgi:hypothetical protein
VWTPEGVAVTRRRALVQEYAKNFERPGWSQNSKPLFKFSEAMIQQQKKEIEAKKRELARIKALKKKARRAKRESNKAKSTKGEANKGARPASKGKAKSAATASPWY